MFIMQPEDTMTLIHDIIAASWDILLEAAPYVLFGFFVAGLLKAYVPASFVARHLGRGHVGPVFKAALFGIPLPLCSCGVIPAAAGLRQQGASKGATTSFLIATPETGVDSMAVTWALLDPVMTVARPFAALLTSVAAGLMVDLFPERKRGESEVSPPVMSPSRDPALHDGPTTLPAPVIAPVLHGAAGIAAPQGASLGPIREHAACTCSGHASVAASACCGTSHSVPAPSGASCGCGSAAHAHSGAGCCGHDAPVGQVGGGFSGAVKRFSGGMRFAFGELVADIGGWLLLGVVLAAVITILIPDDLFSGTFASGIGGILLMMVVGIPLYVCATASTPIAAAFALKGISPGAALVFLLAGPATNVATITVVARMLGRKAAVIYVAVIGVMSVALGLAVNMLYGWLGMGVTGWVQGSADAEPGMPSAVAAVVLLLLVLYQWLPALVARLRGEAHPAGCGCGH